MTTFFTADLHLNHANILQFDPRPFPDIRTHDQYIISTWNTQVTHEDTIYVLGDVGFGSQHYLSGILHALYGHKHLIRGNHDYKMQSKVKEVFESINDYLELKIPDKSAPNKQQRIVLCHYPFEAWCTSYYGTWHLHGHTHGDSLTQRAGRLNVGIQLHDYKLWSYEEIKGVLGKRKPMEV